MRTYQRQSGFTLMELLVTIVIVAMLSALAAPLFGDNDALQLNSAKRLLISDLEHAQILAITNPDMEIGIVFDNDGTGWHIASLDEPKTPLLDTATSEPLVLEFGQDGAYYCENVLVETNSTNNIISFDSSGGLIGFLLDAELTLTIGKSSTVVKINPITGSIK